MLTFLPSLLFLLVGLLVRQLLTLVSAGQSLTASLRSPGGPVTTLSTRPEPGAWRTGPAPRSRSITATCMLKAMEQGKKRIVYFIFLLPKFYFYFIPVLLPLLLSEWTAGY